MTASLPLPPDKGWGSQGVEPCLRLRGGQLPRRRVCLPARSPLMASRRLVWRPGAVRLAAPAGQAAEGERAVEGGAVRHQPVALRIAEPAGVVMRGHVDAALASQLDAGRIEGRLRQAGSLAQPRHRHGRAVLASHAPERLDDPLLDVRRPLCLPLHASNMPRNFPPVKKNPQGFPKKCAGISARRQKIPARMFRLAGRVLAQ